jgi:hypothetical protein
VTFPFPTFVPISVETLIDTTGKTKIGDLTGGGGLAAAFDGTTAQALASCATGVKSGTTPAYVGVDWGAGVTKTVTRFQVWGSSDCGFGNWDPTEYTYVIELQGSTDNFAGSVVTLYTSSPVTDSDGVTLNVTSGMTLAPYRYHRLKITQQTSTGNYTFSVAEVQFYERI